VPCAAVVIGVLRRIAYALLTLFRSITQRSAERRSTPWRQLLHDVHLALVAASELDLANLRPRPPPG
jgi:hypothetical protein